MQFVSFVLSVMLLSAFLGAIAAGPLPRSEIVSKYLHVQKCIVFFRIHFKIKYLHSFYNA